MDIRKQDLQRILNIVHECLDIQDSENIKSVLDKLSELVPFEGAVICDVEKSNNTGHVYFSDVINHSYSSEWGEVYFDNDFIHVDPVIHYSKRTDHAFTWSKAFQNLSQPQPKVREFLTMANDFKLQDGIAHLVQNKGSGTLISLSINDPNNEYYSQLVNHITPHLHEALSHFRNLRPLAPLPELSDREQEVIKWTSEGKSSWDIGVILSISERTVKYHIYNIKNKLNAVNRAHAVAKALRAKLIN